MLPPQLAEPTLRGAKCICPCCRERFGGVRAFDMHRVGVGRDRGCKPPSSMSQLRLDGSFWVQERSPIKNF